MPGFSSVSADIDYSMDGKQVGCLRVVQSANWRNVLIPIACIRNGEGPTLLLLGGTHGDEFEGPVFLMELLRNLAPRDIRGRVIVIPALNYPAIEAGSRCAPSDGRDLNRQFPGRPDGTLSEAIACYVDSTLLPMTDVVLDLHAGGRAGCFLPSLWLLDGPGPELWNRTLEAAEAFGAPMIVVSESLGGDMSESAARRGCVYMSTEAGGGAAIDPEVVGLYRKGVSRLMSHMTLLPARAGPPERQQTRMLRVAGGQAMLLAEQSGLFEPLVRLGDAVEAGQTVGRVQRIESLEEPATNVVCGMSGLVYGMRHAAEVARGDWVAVIAQDA